MNEAVEDRVVEKMQFKYCSPLNLYYVLFVIYLQAKATLSDFSVDCTKLNIGQYFCTDPIIDIKTQQPMGCTSKNTAKVNCTLAEGLICNGTNQTTFKKEISCKYTDRKSFETALLLSVFLGTFGIDRFYLGYPAIGLVKLCTLGFMFLGQLIDIILIATQVVGPADGSNYIISYFGPGITVLKMNNETYKLPQVN